MLPNKMKKKRKFNRLFPLSYSEFKICGNPEREEKKINKNSIFS
jgi:hypothetical protein